MLYGATGHTGTLIAQRGLDCGHRPVLAGRSAAAVTALAERPSIVDVAEHDPAFAEIHSRIQRGHAAPVRSALDRAALRGEIPSTADRDAITATLLGPLFYRRWFSREPIDAKFLEIIIRSTITGLHQDTRRQKRQQIRR